MPLPNITSGETLRCSATCKGRGDRCRNPAAYGMPVCRYHGARKPETVRRGASHPQYRHGQETREAKAGRSKKLAELRDLEALSFTLGLAAGPRWRGRQSVHSQHSHRWSLQQRVTQLQAESDLRERWDQDEQSQRSTHVCDCSPRAQRGHQNDSASHGASVDSDDCYLRVHHRRSDDQSRQRNLSKLKLLRKERSCTMIPHNINRL